jgi:hypothetical protein
MQKKFVTHDFLLLDVLWNDARFVDRGRIATGPRRVEKT